MNITIRNLENLSSTTLVATFNLSFSDYLVPFSLTKEQLEQKMKSENISLKIQWHNTFFRKNRS